MDRMGLGRHTACPFYREFERRRLAGMLPTRSAPPARQRPFLQWLFRLVAEVVRG
jgi:hypothetical protein